MNPEREEQLSATPGSQKRMDVRWAGNGSGYIYPWFLVREMTPQGKIIFLSLLIQTTWREPLLKVACKLFFEWPYHKLKKQHSNILHSGVWSQLGIWPQACIDGVSVSQGENVLLLTSEGLHGVQEEVSGAGELPFQFQEVLKPLTQVQLEKNDAELEDFWVSVKAEYLAWRMVFVFLHI